VYGVERKKTMGMGGGKKKRDLPERPNAQCSRHGVGKCSAARIHNLHVGLNRKKVRGK